MGRGLALAVLLSAACVPDAFVPDAAVPDGGADACFSSIGLVGASCGPDDTCVALPLRAGQLCVCGMFDDHHSLRWSCGTPACFDGSLTCMPGDECDYGFENGAYCNAHGHWVSCGGTGCYDPDANCGPGTATSACPLGILNCTYPTGCYCGYPGYVRCWPPLVDGGVVD